MASYHFPIIVGKDKSERVVIIHLGDEEENKDYEENRVVITSKGGKKTPLFRIPTKVDIISQDGEKPNPPFVFENQNKEKKDCNQIVITIKEGQELKQEEKDNYYNYYLTKDGRFDGTVLFTVLSNDNNNNISGSLHIVRPGTNDGVLHINVDLGSDATQITHFTKESGFAPEFVNIVDCFIQAYETTRKYNELHIPQNEDPLFIQQEKGKNFFYKTGNITFKDKGVIQEPITSDDSFINYLNVSAAGKNEPGNADKRAVTWAKENNYNSKLINIKVLFAADSDDIPNLPQLHFDSETARNNDVYDKHNLRDVLFNIYQQIIQTSIAGKNLNKNAKYCSVLLLVPNIYNQQNIDGLLYVLNKMNKIEGEMKYDFRVISESDSAFVGIKELKKKGAQSTILNTMLQGIKNDKQKDMFLIIDAGKGTTDYSIIEYYTGENMQANNDMVSVERGGIVGAGGAIDYVFTRVFARQIYNHINEINTIIRNNNNSTGNQEGSIEINCKLDNIDEFTDRFMRMIEKLSPIDQDRMMHLVEVLKKEYKVDSDKTALIYNCFANKDAKGIIDVLCDNNLDDSKYDAIKNDQDGWKYVSTWNWDTKSYIEVVDKDKEEIRWVCNEIADSVINKQIFNPTNDQTIRKQIDYVIFTGRSFGFKPLKAAFVDKLQQHRDVYWVNYYRGKVVLKYLWFSLCKKISKKNEERMNLKDASNLKDESRKLNLNVDDMKKVSVRFTNHNLGVNCNSNLCCMDGLTYNHETFDQKHFFEGFQDNNAKSTKRYYIGYAKENDKLYSFAPDDGLDQNPNGANNNNKDLLNMTLYPVYYKPVNFDIKGFKNTKETSSNMVPKTENSPTTDVTDLATAHLNPNDVNQNS